MLESYMATIVPAIMEKEFSEAEKKMKMIYDYFSWIQIDVTDNALVEGKSFELELLNRIELEKTRLWDIHLIVKEPINWIEKCIMVGASRIIGQVEAMKDPDEFIRRVKDEGMEAGVALDIDTPIIKIPEETDVVLLMGRKMGYESRPMEIDKVLKKIQSLKSPNYQIGIDGGVNRENLDILTKAGVEFIYTTSMLFYGNIKENLRDLKINVN